MSTHQGAGSPRARRRRRRSRRSPTTRSCPTATPARSSRRTARSTGCACRASTRRACSARCSTARPARFRLGPFGINVPTARIYEPGTNIVATTWNTPTGWVLVRDALTMGPRHHEDEITPHTRPPADEDARPHAGPHGASASRGSVEVELVCEPDFDYGRDAGRLVAGRRRPPYGRRHRRRAHDQAADRHGARHRGRLGAGPPRARAGRAGLLRALLGRGPRRRRRTSTRRTSAWPPPSATGAAGSKRARLPDHRWRDPIAALGARDQGADLHADRRDGGRGDHLPARDARRGAQLGLPLHLDPRLDVHPPGAALPQPGLGGRRVHAVHRRPRAERATARCRSCTGSTGAAT